MLCYVMTVDLRLFSLINAQDNFPPFPEIFFVQILRIILWRFRTAELDVSNSDRNTEIFFLSEHKSGEPHYNRRYSFEVCMHWLTFCRPIRNAVYCVLFSVLFAGLQAVFLTAFSPCPPPPTSPIFFLFVLGVATLGTRGLIFSHAAGIFGIGRRSTHLRP